MSPLNLKIGQPTDHGFDEPLGLLSDCHRRIERFLGAMLTVTRNLRGGHLDETSRDILQQALRYFATSAPRHTADEEASLFPRLRAASGARAAEALETLDALEADHREAEQRHAVVDRLVRRWVEAHELSREDAETLVDQLESLSASYARHIGIEDHDLFPAAAAILSPADLEEVGREMADRRGVPFRASELLRRAPGARS